MGIAGSIVDQPFFERYLGLRVESVDMSEVNRRMDEGIFDLDEFERALRGRARTAAKGWTATRRQGGDPRATSTTNGRSWSGWRSSRAT